MSRWKRVSLAGVLAPVGALLLTTCGARVDDVAGGSCDAAGWCLCRSACADLPPGATPDKLGVYREYGCTSDDCPTDHICMVTAWSGAEKMYYGKCLFACEPTPPDTGGSCGTPSSEGSWISCIQPSFTETGKGACDVNTFDQCGTVNETYDCRTRIMDYVVGCNDTIPQKQTYETHIGPD